MTKYQDECDWKFKHCAFMCNRLLCLDHGELGLPDVKNKDIQLLKQLYRDMKTVSAKMHQLYYKSIKLSKKLIN